MAFASEAPTPNVRIAPLPKLLSAILIYATGVNGLDSTGNWVQSQDCGMCPWLWLGSFRAFEWMIHEITPQIPPLVVKGKKANTYININTVNSPRSLKGFLGEKEIESWILQGSDSKWCESTGQDRQHLAPAKGLQKGRLKTPPVNLRAPEHLKFSRYCQWELQIMAGRFSHAPEALPERGITARKGHPHHGQHQRDSAWWDESWDQRRVPGLLDRHLHKDPESRNSYLKVIFVLAAWDSSLVSIITSSRALVHINHLKTYDTSHDCYILVHFSHCRRIKKEPEDSHIIISIKP